MKETKQDVQYGCGLSAPDEWIVGGEGRFYGALAFEAIK